MEFGRRKYANTYQSFYSIDLETEKAVSVVFGLNAKNFEKSTYTPKHFRYT